MGIETLAVLSAALFSLVALGVCIAILRRLRAVAEGGNRDERLTHLEQAAERLERLVREESGRDRAESALQSKALREELSAALRGFQESTLKTMAEMQALQKGQLELFAAQLGEGVNAIERRVGESAKESAESALARHEAIRLMLEGRLGELLARTAEGERQLREELGNYLRHLGAGLGANIEAISVSQKERLEAVARELAEFTRRQEEAQGNLRKGVEERLDLIRRGNEEKLEQMRATVDEKLQGTLEKRLGESFKLVSERLEQVHRGLGEMQSLATGVGDLKRVLTNVKTRGTWGEVQLGALLEQMLTPDQYERDAVTRPGSQERVEFAIRLPGLEEQESLVLLPIDAKFPHEDYDRLLQAVDRADADGVERAARELENSIKNSAKSIRDKYINPPHTTDFAILFLPTEGLYAEVLRRPGLVELVQREFRVTLAGPTTLGAMLSALRMGFRTLAIQKRSSEVWEILGAVKTEFGKYGDVLEKVQKKLQEASKTIDEVGVRKRAIDRRLRKVESLPDTRAEELLGIAALEEEEGERVAGG